MLHPHIQHYAEIMKPSHDTLHGYRSTQLEMTKEQHEAYVKIQQAITKSASLYFVDEHAPITMQTVASDYGIETYPTQKVGGVDRPIASISKLIDSTWSTPEKEGYAIFYPLKKLGFLLRDVHFNLQTNHKNLIYINDTASSKVLH